MFKTPTLYIKESIENFDLYSHARGSAMNSQPVSAPVGSIEASGRPRWTTQIELRALKQQAKARKAELGGHSRALDAVARERGYANWADVVLSASFISGYSRYHCANFSSRLEKFLQALLAVGQGHVSGLSNLQWVACGKMQNAPAPRELHGSNMPTEERMRSEGLYQTMERLLVEPPFSSEFTGRRHIAFASTQDAFGRQYVNLIVRFVDGGTWYSVASEARVEHFYKCDLRRVPQRLLETADWQQIHETSGPLSFIGGRHEPAVWGFRPCGIERDPPQKPDIGTWVRYCQAPFWANV